MSKFFVGQRVRLVRPLWLEHTGYTGRIKETFNERPGRSYAVDCDVDWDRHLSPFSVSQTHTSRLEPILPEGMQIVPLEQVINVIPALERILGVSA